MYKKKIKQGFFDDVKKRNFNYQYFGSIDIRTESAANFSKSIQVDITKYPKISDIKKLIASDLHIKDSQLTIKNQPPEQQLKNLPNNYTFQISIDGFCPNLDFYLPDGKIIQVKNGYKIVF